MKLLLATLLVLRVHAGTLEIRLTSGGRPTAARVYITNAAGEPVKVAGVVSYLRRQETHLVVDGLLRADLPPGIYHIRAEKGHEYGVAKRTVEAGATDVVVSLEIPRLHDMNRRGWYSGDTHTHRDPAGMALLARAEGLNVAPVITRHVGDSRPAATPFPSSHLIAIDASHVVTQQNQEVERLAGGFGAVLLLNMAEAVEKPLASLHPLDVEFCRRARAAGAFIDGEKPIWKNMPVLVALGLVDSIGIVNNHFHPNGMLLDAERYGSMERDKPVYHTVSGFAQWMMDIYYSFLDCGFRLPVSAGSASGVMPSWPGYERVYVKLDGAFSHTEWFRRLKAGASIATNGPLLDVAIGGKPPGAEFPIDKPREVAVSVEVHSRHPVERVDVVFNGEVLHTAPVHQARWKGVLKIKLTGPGWLTVRCFEPTGNTIRYAHSSPYYFTRNQKLPVNASAALRWADYIDKLGVEASPGKFPTPEAHERAQQILRAAGRIYREAASRSETR
ncbi:MAG: CehA/McbA family metallohydrolase [Acidobacteria bacterium]|nr:CehA/McbA family metallohydrolase [Acidobacteriota bacterium]